MSRNFKNVLRLKETPYGKERRRNIAKETVKDSTPLPQPLEYKDIDKEFRRWVDEDLDMTYDGNKLPTVTLFSNQRFSEYMQTWQNVDDKKNLILNFKTIYPHLLPPNTPLHTPVSLSPYLYRLIFLIHYKIRLYLILFLL